MAQLIPLHGRQPKTRLNLKAREIFDNLDGVSLAERFEWSDEDGGLPITHCVEGLLPDGGNALLVGPAKVAKTTFTHNLIRALADDLPFLDHFALKPGGIADPLDGGGGRIAFFNNEMSEATTESWLRDQDIKRPERIELYSMKGRAYQLDLLDPDCRAAWARELWLKGIDFVVFDCLRPVLDALGLSEDKDAGRFLVAFDALLHDASVSSGSVIVHHTGHDGTRARGDSRLIDWADANWQLRRDGNGSRRRLIASGRDVDLSVTLDYEPTTRRFHVVGDAAQKADEDTGGGRTFDEYDHVRRLHEILMKTPRGLTTRNAVAELRSGGLSESESRAIVKKAVSDGAVHQTPGSKRSLIVTAEPTWKAIQLTEE